MAISIPDAYDTIIVRESEIWAESRYFAET